MKICRNIFALILICSCHHAYSLQNETKYDNTLLLKVSAMAIKASYIYYILGTHHYLALRELSVDRHSGLRSAGCHRNKRYGTSDV